MRTVCTFGVAALVLLGVGCSSVKVVQRDGCWVKRHEKAFGQVNEELGPCVRQPTEWAQDRQTRLVQECVTQADHRWQTQAIAAWSRGEPLPDHDQEGILQACMSEAGRAMVAENDALKQRLSEVEGERQALAAAVDENRVALHANNEKLTEFLGQAAQKPAGTATATATSLSDTAAKTEHGSSVQSAPASFVPAQQFTPVCTHCEVQQSSTSASQAAPAQATPAKKAPVKRASSQETSRAGGPACELPPKATDVKADQAKIADAELATSPKVAPQSPAANPVAK